MNRCHFIILVIFVYVHKSYEYCATHQITGERRECYYYDGDYANYIAYYGDHSRYNKEEEACWTNLGSKVICRREKEIPILETSDCIFLEILDSDISTVTLNSFRDMTNLSTINIIDCNVSKIELGAFNGVHNLENVSLSNNAITTITKGIFNQLIHLKELNISKNKINIIEKGSLLGPDLKKIYVNNNEIEDVTPFVENCQELDVFDIAYNNVSRLESIRNCISLTELYASNNFIKELSPDLFTQLPLRVLDLSSNLLDDIDINTFNGLEQLETLDLSVNKINNGQPNIGIFQHLQNLRNLNLSSNSITNLQLGIFSKLSKLRILDISNNQLISFSEEMFHDLESLEELYINNNLLTSIGFNRSPGFRELFLDWNPWNCQELSRIVKYYGNAIIRGTSHNTSNIYGISCMPVTSNKDSVHLENNINENDKVGYVSLLGEIFEKSVKKINDELLRQNENITTALQELLGEIQNNANGNQNLFTSIQQYFDQNQENFKTTLKQNQNSSNTLRDFLKVIVTQTQNSSNILKEILSQNNNNAIKQTNEHDSTKIGAGILEKFSEKAEQQFEKLLSIFNNTQTEKELIRSYVNLFTTLNNTLKQDIIQSEKLEGNVVPHNSNIFVGVLIVQIVFLIAFCLTVFYFIRSIKIRHQIQQTDEIRL